MRHAVAGAVVLLALGGCSHSRSSLFVGHYSPPTLFIAPCDYDLTLLQDGTFRLHGTKNRPGEGAVREGFEIVGRWNSDGMTIRLTPKLPGETIQLTVSSEGSALVLSDGEIFGVWVRKDAQDQLPETMTRNELPAVSDGPFVRYSVSGSNVTVVAAVTPFDGQAKEREAFLHWFKRGFGTGYSGGTPLMIEWDVTPVARAGRRGYEFGLEEGAKAKKEGTVPDQSLRTAPIPPSL